MRKRSVQAYIEEVPSWEGGTHLAGPPLSSMQWLVWALATAGKFFEGLIVFMGGIALPLVAEQFAMTSTDKGLVTAATLAGILIGALALGGLADRFGRKPVFIGEMVLLALALVGAAFSTGTIPLVTALFVIGLALGADYPTAHLVISESIPAAVRGRLVLGAFSFQAVGAVLGTAIAVVVLSSDHNLNAWRIFYLLPVVPVSLVVWGRLFLPESSHWLVSKGKMDKAEKQLRKLLGRNDVELLALEIAEEGRIQRSSDWRSLFRGKLQRATILASVPWFLQDISTYGIGIFTPVIIAAAFGATAKEHTVAAVIHNALLGARGTALVDLGCLVGIACAIALVDRWGRIPLQIVGFVGCAVGLMLAASGNLGGQSNLPVMVAGFVLFQFMTNLGPNAQTYLLAGEVFPTPVRGLGAGLAAAIGKVGAVLTAFLFPILLADWGTERLLPLLAITSLLGAAITWIYRIETTGKTMDSI
jgi:MFS transporter, putative metabolite transport protein